MGKSEEANMEEQIDAMDERSGMSSIDFDMYNDTCSDCTKHNQCHKNGIDYDAVEKCVKEINAELRRLDGHAR